MDKVTYKEFFRNNLSLCAFPIKIKYFLYT